MRFAVILAIWLAFVACQRWLLRRGLLSILSLQFNLMVLTLLSIIVLGPALDQMDSRVRTALKALALFLGVAIGLKLADSVFFDRLARLRQRPPVPQVLRDIGRWVVATVAGIVIVRSFFPTVNLNVLAVSSLVVGYIVGNATQDTLGNLFSGLALNAERPFQIGDWVSVGGHTGLVVDVTWRATRLRTRTEDFIIIPNASIGKDSITNFSRPTQVHGCYLTIRVSHHTPPTKAREAILNAIRDAPDVCSQPVPTACLMEFGPYSLDFKVKYFITDFARLEPIQSTVMDRIWYTFRREGISIPYPVQEELHRNAPQEDAARHAAEAAGIKESLSNVELFRSLSSEESGLLARVVKLRKFAPGEILCRQGEPGDSFYVIREGRVAVDIKDHDGRPTRAAVLEAGSFFGEMSLLTGEPRSGTVTTETDVEVLCVSKPDFAMLLKRNADLAGQLAEALQKRVAARREIMESVTGTKQPAVTHSALTARILQFFGMG